MNNNKEKKREKGWIYRGSNPRPFACKANVIPLHHIPESEILFQILIHKLNFPNFIIILNV